MTPSYIKQLGIKTWQANVRAPKIDLSSLKTFRIIIAIWQVSNKLYRAQFFQETILLAKTSRKMVLGMLFLSFTNIDNQIVEKELVWRTYIAIEALPTTRRVKRINKKDFTKAVLYKDVELFVINKCYYNQ